MSNGGTIYWRIYKLEKEAEDDRRESREAIQRLEQKMDRLTLAILGFAFTIAASGIGVVAFTGGGL